MKENGPLLCLYFQVAQEKLDVNDGFHWKFHTESLDDKRIPMEILLYQLSVT